jgi:hypothetical protein
MVDIQAILRHKNLATTERYIQRLDSLRPALNVLEGQNRKPLTGVRSGDTLLISSFNHGEIPGT